MGMGSHQDEKSSVLVVVRVRPLSGKESGTETCIRVLPQDHLLTSTPTFHTIQVGEETELGRKYTFDHVLPEESTQKDVYCTCVDSLVQSCLEGYNATIFAYGQTGSGKTHTMIGDIGRQDGDAGVIPRALEDIFLGLNQKSKSKKVLKPLPRSSHKNSFEYQVKVQFIELYGEEIHDLVVNKFTDHNQTLDEKAYVTSNLVIRDGKVGEDAEVVGACQAKIESSQEALEYLQRGMEMRRTEQTEMNAESSRSHAIFTLMIQQTQRKVSTEPDDAIGISQKSIVEMKTSKIHFVDLAGSERIKSAKTKGKRMQEGININKGLFVLGNVISSLGNLSKQANRHVPYRDSKLTRLLKGSLGGNHKTLMIGCASPSNSSRDETMNTLRYANRAKNIKNHAKVNIDPSSRVVNELQAQVTTLAKELLRIRGIDEDVVDCPFSFDFLARLIQASGTSSKSLPTAPSSTPDLTYALSKSLPPRPTTCPASTDATPLVDEGKPLQDTQNDVCAKSMKQLSTKFDAIPEEIKEIPNKIGDKPVFYDVARTLMRNLSNIKQLKDRAMEEGDADLELKTCRRKAWRDLRDNDSRKDLEEPNDFEINENRKIALYESMYVSIKDVFEGASATEDKELFDNGIEDDLEKSGSVEMNENKTITLYDSMRASMQEALRASIQETLSVVTATEDTNNPNSTQKAEVEDDYYPHKDTDPTDTYIRSKDRYIKPNEDFTSIMNQYHQGYKAFKLDNEINVIQSKINKCKEEWKYLEGIIYQLEKNSFHSVEVEKASNTMEGEIIKLQTEQKECMGLLNARLNRSASTSRRRTSNISALTLDEQMFSSIRNKSVDNNHIMDDSTHTTGPTLNWNNSYDENSSNSKIISRDCDGDYGQDCVGKPSSLDCTSPLPSSKLLSRRSSILKMVHFSGQPKTIVNSPKCEVSLDLGAKPLIFPFVSDTLSPSEWEPILNTF